MKGKIFRSILVLAFVLSLVAVPLHGVALAEEGQQIYLTPKSSSPGTAVMVTGLSFTPDTEVKVYFDGELVALRQVDSTGNLIVSFSAVVGTEVEIVGTGFRGRKHITIESSA